MAYTKDHVHFNCRIFLAGYVHPWDTAADVSFHTQQLWRISMVVCVVAVLEHLTDCSITVPQWHMSLVHPPSLRSYTGLIIVPNIPTA